MSDSDDGVVDGTGEADELSPVYVVVDGLNRDVEVEMHGTEGEGEWLRIKNGITIGSGAWAFVMPDSLLPGV